MTTYGGRPSTGTSNEAPKDYEVPHGPNDSVSEVSFSPVAEFFAVSSWDTYVRIYEANSATGAAVGKALYNHEKPALCCAWSKDGTKVISGGADNAGRCFDITSQQVGQIAIHDQPIKCIKYIENHNLVLTGSWDKTLKYWDMRSSTPVLTVNLPERCYALDVTYPVLVVGCAERHVQMFDLSKNPSTPVKSIVSPLKWQTRCISTFLNRTGYAIGSIEGRVGIQYFEEKDNQSSFSFKCHREQNHVHAVNAISFHPIYGTFSTAGSDGTFNFWDKDSKQRLKGFSSIGGPITSTAFNRNGSIFAYALSYDWNKGLISQPQRTAVYLHAVKDEDVKPKPPKKR
ncbi:10724_t:CDS:2 [Funneliformis caledonium]|uniref:10724_t:CDS:1 n=2 Tax=Funneliformis TaxID=1117308 RepID=A0A9N9ELI3_9GLOM|nr:486_t:CDS:2 [Funneliformis mosseae]CAG8681778.1 10724_t:CDS:2 [Funneliformis caledonium]